MDHKTKFWYLKGGGGLTLGYILLSKGELNEQGLSVN